MELHDFTGMRVMAGNADTEAHDVVIQCRNRSAEEVHERFGGAELALMALRGRPPMRAVSTTWETEPPH